MILKGNQRAGGTDLATHLMNAFDNERVEVAQIRGTVADHLHGAFAEYEALAAGTRCKEPLYSLSVNPSAPLSREQYYAAIDRIEQRLGLSGQARAVVFHVKHGREHAHVVWCRIDTTKMRAVQLSHDRQKLRSLARELAMEFGLELPEGLAEDKRADRARKNEQTLAEKAQAEATGITPEQRRAEITQAYRRSDSAEAFRAALKEKGYVLAAGDKRVYVVVDRFGKVHSLARQIDGVRTREVRQKLAAIEAQVEGVDAAKAAIAQRERLVLDRRTKALSRLETWELRSLETAVRRQVQEMEVAREQKAETVQDQIEVNKLDIVLPQGELHADAEKKKGWKARQDQLGAGKDRKQDQSRGYRIGRDRP